MIAMATFQDSAPTNDRLDIIKGMEETNRLVIDYREAEDRLIRELEDLRRKLRRNTGREIPAHPPAGMEGEDRVYP